MLTKISAAEAELFEEMSKTRYGAALTNLLTNEDRLLKNRLVGTLEKDEMLRLQGECRFLQRLTVVLTKP
jgi:hypothetical protein